MIFVCLCRVNTCLSLSKMLSNTLPVASDSNAENISNLHRIQSAMCEMTCSRRQKLCTFSLFARAPLGIAKLACNFNSYMPWYPSHGDTIDCSNSQNVLRLLLLLTVSYDIMWLLFLYLLPLLLLVARVDLRVEKRNGAQLDIEENEKHTKKLK